MQVNQKYLKDETGNIISPITSVDSVVSSNGKKLIDLIYPVGAIFMSVVNTNPQTYLGGTWVIWGSGKTIVGVNTSETEFSTVEKTGGRKEIQLSTIMGPYNSSLTSLSYAYKTISGSSDITKNISIYKLKGIQNDTTTLNIQNHFIRIFDDETIKNYNNIHKEDYDKINITQPYITCYMFKRTA